MQSDFKSVLSGSEVDFKWFWEILNGFQVFWSDFKWNSSGSEVDFKWIWRDFEWISDGFQMNLKITSSVVEWLEVDFEMVSINEFQIYWNPFEDYFRLNNLKWLESAWNSLDFTLKTIWKLLKTI